MSIWHTPGLPEELERLVNDGLSAGQVAYKLSNQFKFTISRLAIIGRVSRTPHLQLRYVRPVTPPKPKREPKVSKKVKPVIPFDAFIVPKPKGEVPGGCCFPMWGEKIDRTLFCGNAKDALTPYCPYHQRLVWRPQNIQQQARAA